MTKDFARSCLLLLRELGITVMSEPDCRMILLPTAIHHTDGVDLGLKAVLNGIDKILGEGVVEQHLENKKELLS